MKNKALIYLTFPSENSINFPSRNGTLNYYDDKTHRDNPPNFKHTINLLKANNVKILKSKANYQPFLMNIIGNLIEPYSKYKNKVFPGTWEKWGFETIIIGQKDI